MKNNFCNECGRSITQGNCKCNHKCPYCKSLMIRKESIYVCKNKKCTAPNFLRLELHYFEVATIKRKVFKG
jgi:hypothetical protein